MKAYIAGPMSEIQTFEVLARYERIGDVCLDLGIDVFIPHLNNRFSASPQRIFITDYLGLKECDLVIADIGSPSTGTGIELGLALAWGKKILAYHHQEQQPSAMASGLCQARDEAILVESYVDSSGRELEHYLRLLLGEIEPVTKQEAIWAGRSAKQREFDFAEQKAD